MQVYTTPQQTWTTAYHSDNKKYDFLYTVSELGIFVDGARIWQKGLNEKSKMKNSLGGPQLSSTPVMSEEK